MTEVFTRYKVVLQINDKILGGIPVGFEREADINVREEMKTTAAKAKVGPYSTFHRDKEGRICLEEKNVKGLLKECVQTLYGRGRQSTLTQKVVQRGVFIDPKEIVIADDVSGRLRRPVHAMTMKGPRTSLQEVDYVEKPTIEFTVKSAAPEINLETLAKLLALGEEIGLGAVRSMGYGKFTVKSLG